jgi:hypothetical protein
MSWIEKIQKEFVIQTGDGRKYYPNWVDAVKSVDYNISEFNFPNLKGTLVVRGTPKGTKYGLTLFFQKEDHLDFSDEFKISAEDPRPWTISHPYYGTIIVQPTSLDFDNSKHNVTKITGTVIETITEDAPRITVSPVDKITNDKLDLDTIFEQSFANDVTPNTSDISVLKSNNSNLYNEGKKSILDSSDFETYFNAFNNANSFIDNATSEPLAAIRQLQAVINAPALFATSVENRIKTLANQLVLLRNSLAGIVERAHKKIFENNCGCIISSMCTTSVTNYTYNSRDAVFNSVDLVLNSYNTYISDLDSLQTDNGGKEDSYIPDADSLIKLSSLVNYTVSNLFDVALNSKQERSVICEEDTNIILLAHRFYGPQQDDSAIQTIIDNNNIGLNEMLEVRKGRKIVYYI